MVGREGSRLAAHLGLSASRSKLLRLVHALPEPDVAAVPVISVDDFCNGPIEGVNFEINFLKRQANGKARFTLLRKLKRVVSAIAVDRSVWVDHDADPRRKMTAAAGAKGWLLP